MLTNHGGGIVGTAIDEVKVSPFRCERCGCGLICGPQELLLCSTCLPAEVVELRAEILALKKQRWKPRTEVVCVSCGAGLCAPGRHES